MIKSITVFEVTDGTKPQLVKRDLAAPKRFYEKLYANAKKPGIHESLGVQHALLNGLNLTLLLSV